MSGTDAHLGGLGVLIEYKQSKHGAQRFGGKAGYEGYLNNDVATLPEILSDNGYYTVMSGKVGNYPVLDTSEAFIQHERWLILTYSGTSDYALAKDPLSGVFRRLLRCFLAVAITMAGSPCRSVSPWEAPRCIQRMVPKLTCELNHYIYTISTSNIIPRSANTTGDPEGFYSTDYYTDRLIQYFEDRSDDEKEKPFFAFLPYTAPHWPLQCSKEQRDK